LPHPEQILSLDAFPKETLPQERQNISMTEEVIANAMTAFDLTKEEILSLHTAFKAYDRDGDGAITINDLHIVFGENIQDDMLKEWIKKNNSGVGEKVVFNDFLIKKKESRGLSCDEMLAYLLTYFIL
jgi:Ca2+-binding EF-hand superfamily protein